MILDIIQNGKDDVQESLMDLLEEKPVHGVVDADLVYFEITSSEDTIYSFLLTTGYLKIKEKIGMIGDAPICNLTIPNKEIKQVFKKEILDHLSQNIAPSVIRSFQLALKTNNKDALQTTLREYLVSSASCFDTAYENFYHGLMLGLLAIMSDDYQITSNRESGAGRFDIQLKPLSKKFPTMIMEFKAEKNANEEQLIASADKAIQQVLDKNYCAELHAKGVTDIQVYGIAFCKKMATVRVKVVK